MDVQMNETQTQRLTRSVAKALGILESFTERVPSLSFTELAQSSDLAPSTLRRLLTTLESLGYLQQDAHGLYRLGARALGLAPPALAGYEVRNQALPVLDELSVETGLNSNLGILYDGRMLYLASVARNLPHRRLFGVPGRMAAAHSTALGKVLLAFRPFGEVVAMLEKAGGLIRRTPKTITTWEALEAELARVRELGYAFDDEEAASGGLCVAAPARDRTGEVVAAISASGMSWEIDRAKLDELAAKVVRQAETLSYKLGYAFAAEW